jgi:hypothetical protein
VLLLLGCLRAVHPVEGAPTPRLEGRISVELPAGWEVKANSRAFGNHHLLLDSPDPTTQVTIDLVREAKQTRSLDLLIVGEGYALDHGRSLGIQATVTGHHRLEVDNREAWAITTLRKHGPHERMQSTVVLRGSEHLAILSLHTLPEADPGVVAGWGQILDSFHLMGDPAPELAPFARDAEMELSIDNLPDTPQ